MIPGTDKELEETGITYFGCTSSRLGVECHLLAIASKTHRVRISLTRLQQTRHAAQDWNPESTLPARVSSLPFMA